MTRLRQIAMAGLAAIAIGGVASSASAMESGTFQNRLNGATIGLPLGAAPPPGLYTGLETAYLGMIGDNSGHSVGNQCARVSWWGLCCPARARSGGPAALGAGLELVARWRPYSASVVQAFYVFTACNQPGSGGNCNGSGPTRIRRLRVHQHVLQPIALSWNLGGGWFMSAGFNFTSPNGTHHDRHAEPRLLDV